MTDRCTMTIPSVKVSASMLASDYANMGAQARKMQDAGSDWLHLDVMDGSFVPPISFGAQIIAALRKHTDLYFDAHLMTVHPEHLIDAMAKAGVQSLTVHAEVCTHLQRVLKQIQEAGMKAGVALNPATPIEQLHWVLDDVDLILIMTVNPGYGGQKLIAQMPEKVRCTRRLIQHSGREIDLQVDGGVNEQTAKLLVDAGANVLVAGNYLFSAQDTAQAIRLLRG